MPVRLYAVLRLRPRKRGLLPAGVKGERLTILSCAGCSVAVADTLGPLEPAVDNLLEFDRVIRALEDLSDAILPARFGAVSQSRAALKSEIAGSAGALAEALDNVAGRVQMNVRIPLDPEGPGKSLRRGTGSAYLQARAARSCPSALKTLRQAVADLVRDERIEPGPGGAVVYHLIDRADAGSVSGGGRRPPRCRPFSAVRVCSRYRSCSLAGS